MNRITAVLLLLCSFVLISGCSPKVEDAVFEAAMSAERFRAGLEKSTVNVDEIRWVYLRNDWLPGRETVVLLHGFSADKDNWTRFAGAFGDGYNLVIPDLPGHGESSQEMSLAYDVDTQASRVLSLLTALGVDKFHLAGNSMGGAISVRTAWLGPARVLSLGLFDPAGAKRADSEFDALIAQGINPLVVRQPEDFQHVIDYAMADPPFMPWPVKTVMTRRGIARAELNDKIFSDLRRENGIDQTAILPEVHARTLVIWGDQDRLLNVANADAFAEDMPAARKHIFEQIGHLPMLEAPADSAEVYRAFIAGP